MIRPASRPPPAVHAVRWRWPTGVVTRCGRGFLARESDRYTLTDADAVTCAVCRRAVARWSIEPVQTINSADGRLPVAVEAAGQVEGAPTDDVEPGS